MRLLRVLQSAAFLAGLAFFVPNMAAAQACNLDNLRPGLNDNCTIQFGGRARVFDVIVPRDMSKAQGIIYDAHGFGSNEDQQRSGSGLSRLATEGKAVVAFPRGIATSHNGQTCCGQADAQNIDDVGLAKAIIGRVDSSLKFTPIVIGASGISNGMSLTDEIACTAGDFFDLASGVSFQFVNNLAARCRNAGKGTIYSEFHATNDQTVPFGGGLLQTANAAQAPRAFAQIRGCDMTAQQARLNSNTTCQTFNGCDGGGFVQMCTVQGGNHVLYPFVGVGDEQPDFDKAYENLFDMAVQLNRRGMRTADLPVPMTPAPAADPAPAPMTPAPAPLLP